MSILIHNALVVDGSGASPYRGWLLTDGPVIAAMGEGGLCLGCENCTFPNCGFGK